MLESVGEQESYRKTETNSYILSKYISQLRLDIETAGRS